MKDAETAQQFATSHDCAKDQKVTTREEEADLEEEPECGELI